LLLVPTGELADRGEHVRCLDVQARPVLLSDPELLVAVYPPPGGQLAQTGCGDVPADVLDEVQPVVLAVLGGVGDAGPDRIGDGRRGDLPAVHQHPTGDLPAVGAPEQAHRELGAPGTHQTGDADHLAGTYVHVHRVDHHPADLGGVVDGPVLHAEHLVADLRCAFWEPVGQVASD